MPNVKTSQTSTPARTKRVVSPRVVEASKPTQPVKPNPVRAVPAPAVIAPVIPTPSVAAVATPVTPAAPIAAPAVKDAIMDTTTIKTATDKTQAQAKEIFSEMNDRAKGAVDKGQKLVAEMTDLSKGNVEAIVEAAKVAAKGAEDIARYTADYGRQAIEKANATAKDLAGAKSPTEFFQIQSDASRKAIDAMVAETSKFTESYLKLWGEIVQPVSNRVAVAMEKVKVAA
jgi:phasin family protein